MKGDSFWPIGRWGRNGITSEDAQLLPYRKMLPKDAKEAVGSRKWIKHWKQKYSEILPIVISTENKGLLLDSGEEFGSPAIYNLDFNMKDFPANLKNFEIK
ncbi:MAG: hypothetical protein ABEJ25_07165 [Candidatus Bipolaricaulia bacterium]